MKKLLVVLFSLLQFGATKPTVEPTDPAELHDFLFNQACALVKPYLFLNGETPKDATSRKAKAEIEKGIGLFERVLLMNPQNWGAAWFAGKAAQSLGDQERAYRFFRRSYALQQQNPDVTRELMITCMETNRAKEAVPLAQEAVRLNDSDPGLKANLGLALLCSGDLVGAEAAVDAALKGDPHGQISLTLKRLIGEVKRGERKQPKSPADLQD